MSVNRRTFMLRAGAAAGGLSVTFAEKPATARVPAGTSTSAQLALEGSRTRYRTGRTMRLIERRFVVLAIAAVFIATQSPGMARQAEAPAELRALLEGTWELGEGHVDGEGRRPPQAGGRWLNHDGVVVATFHRETAAGFESFVGYGTYEMDASNWSYTYERVQTASGPSSTEAAVTVRSGGEPRRFTIVRDGDAIVLEGTNDRREYADGYFSYMPNGTLLRKYRKVEE